MFLNLVNKRTAKAILPAQLEEMFAAGSTQVQIAARLKMSPGYLARRIANSKTLFDARKRGIERFRSGKSLADRLKK